MVRLKKPDEDDFIKIQRREFVRIETTIDAAIHSSNMEFTPFTTVTEDISAGGTAILIPKDITLSPDSSINTWLALPLKSGIIQYLNIKSRFVRLIEREGSTKNIASIKFTDISDSDRQIIIRFCFEKQLENRNNV
ncbi:MULTISPECIES: flagellar brake protein [Bacillus]|uniref:flagellar brake protein n=1 Tax=Bacillus TaxID=1386 RepID=UPI0003102A9A|nr:MULTISPECIES: PilZ domain-containing protein [Bacillus]